MPYYHLTTDTDLNTLTKQGIYTISATCTNAPTTNWCLVIVVIDIGTPFQIFMGDNSNVYYKRSGKLVDGKFTSEWKNPFA